RARQSAVRSSCSNVTHARRARHAPDFHVRSSPPPLVRATMIAEAGPVQEGALSARMSVVINFQQALGIDPGVDLRGRQGSVPEQLLEGSQGGAARKEMCREQ